MFDFCIKYLFFLKYVPLAPHIFDAMLRIEKAIRHPEVLRYIDEIEEDVLRWEGSRATIHKLGGVQFNINGKEIGHIHSNGLLDILFSKKIKGELISAGRAVEHHSYKTSGWISFYIRTEKDRDAALKLLEHSKELKAAELSHLLGHV
jgi:hypothetical protein